MSKKRTTFEPKDLRATIQGIQDVVAQLEASQTGLLQYAAGLDNLIEIYHKSAGAQRTTAATIEKVMDGMRSIGESFEWMADTLEAGMCPMCHRRLGATDTKLQ